MLKRLLALLVGRRCHRAWLAAGLWLAATALYQMGQTAVFVCKAQVVQAVVTDVRQKPFASTAQALAGGNLSWADDTSYLPTVRFTLPNGVPITRELQQADNRDYAAGEELSLLTYANDPTAACPYRFKFLWGGDALRLLSGLFCLLLWRLLRGRGRGMRRAAAKPRSESRPQSAPRERAAAKEPAKPLKKEAPQQEAPAKQPRRKKSAAAKGEDSPKPRKSRSRKKKAADESPLLPL